MEIYKMRILITLLISYNLIKLNYYLRLILKNVKKELCINLNDFQKNFSLQFF
jgi:hypothetical protein